ncbi:MAG: extracellular solute-binding protein, partial [Ruminococcus sp.]|nr:extracellular solute-binding protein [Ruminococcus sp.]
MKKFLALLLAVLMLASILVACGGGGDKKTSDGGDASIDIEDGAKLLVWAPDKAIDLTKELCEAFKKEHSDKNITIDVQVQSESEAATQVLNDKDAAADVFGFASDQFNKLMTANALAPVFDPDDIIDRNSETSVKAATGSDGALYAFPETDDNGYFLVYDKSIISDEQAASFEGILEACRKAGKKFVMDAGNGYYSCIFIFTGGLTLEGTDAEGTQQFNSYDEEAVVDSLEAFANLFHDYSDVFLSSEVAKIPTGMAADPQIVAAGIDGTWDTNAIKEALGDNYGAAKLPTVKIKGEDKQMISLHGYKLIGVNAVSEYPNAAQALADFLTNEESQIKRAEGLGWGPSNTKAKEDKSVTDSPSISAALAQSENSVAQVNMSDTFWSPMATL